MVEDYGHVGLTLRAHPLSFLRADLRRRRIVTWREVAEARDRRWVEAAGIVLVRQRPGSAKSVMFITMEDETGVANLVLWAKVFEAHRRVVMGAGMVAARGRVQREGGTVHLVVERLTDLSLELASVGARDASFPVPHGRGNEVHHGLPGLDPCDDAGRPKARDVHNPDLRANAIRVAPRDFR